MPQATANTEEREQRPHRSLFSRVGERLTRSAHDVEVAELLQSAERRRCTRISDLVDRQVATVSGTVRAMTLRPKVTAPALVVDLYDGSRTVHLVWLGRRTIGGIRPGAYLQASGRVTYVKGVPTMFNPAYEIVPDDGR
jgi:RecG-like helicase